MGINCCCNRENMISTPRQIGNKAKESKPECSMIRSPQRTLRKNTEDVLNFSDLTIHPGDFVRRRSEINLVYEKVGDIIGEGTYGQVTKMRHLVSGEIRACKIIPKQNIMIQFTEDDIINEIEILKSLAHINIIKIYEFFIDEKNYYIITEYLEQGDLFSKLDELNLDEFNISAIIKQILQAVNYLNSKQILHGDLKLENILIERIKKLHHNHNDINYVNIKLIDFGCSKIFIANEKYQELIGTVYYSSPEVLRGEYDEKCDIWSTGIIMYILLSGKMPFKGDSLEAIKKKILNEKYEIDYNIPELGDNFCSKQAIELMKMLLVYDPKKRLTASEALNNPWFKDVSKSEENLVPLKMAQNVLLNLKNYRREMKFKLAVTTFITHNIGQNDEVNKLKLVFKLIDKDNDGKISLEELKYSLKLYLGTLAASEAELIFKEMEVNLEEGIEYEDFLRVTIHWNKILNEENLKAAFDLFDVKKEGSISAEGLKNVLCGERQVADDVVKEFLSEIHKNPEEKIGYKEFTSLMYDKFNHKFNNSFDSYSSDSKEEILLTEGSSESIEKILNTK